MLTVAIQAHPRRHDAAELLLAELGEGRIVYDPCPEQPPSAWRTYREILDTAPTEGHLLVLQDDVQVCASFLATVTRAVSARPDRLLALFVAGQPAPSANAVQQAVMQGRSWAIIDPSRWCPTVALVWPARLIPEILAYVDAQTWPAEFVADDEIVGRFLRHIRERCLATAPSLVEHPDHLPSLIRRRINPGSSGRVAACFIHPDCDPLTIDWTLGPE